MPRQPTQGCTLAITTTRRQKKMRLKVGAFTSTCQVSRMGPLDQPCHCPDSSVCLIRDFKKYKSNKCLLQKIRKIQENAQNEAEIICNVIVKKYSLLELYCFENNFYCGILYWYYEKKNLKCIHFCSVQSSSTNTYCAFPVCQASC